MKPGFHHSDPETTWNAITQHHMGGECPQQVVSLGMLNGDHTIHREESCNSPEGTNPLWTHNAADYKGQIPWTYCGQGTDS